MMRKDRSMNACENVFRVSGVSFRMAAVACAALVSGLSDADTVYSGEPDDTSGIVVKGGRTTISGLDAFRSLTQRWTFDDADDIYGNSVGSVSLAPVNDDRYLTEDSKIGGGAAYVDHGLVASENVIDGKSPFTVMFWLKKNMWGTQDSLVYIGREPEYETQIQDTPFFHLCYGNDDQRLLIFENHIVHRTGNEESALFETNRWNHIALTCRQIEKDGCVTTNGYQVYVNGSAYLARNCPVNDFTENCGLYFGRGWHYSGLNRYVYGAYDEIMVFDTCLDEDDINAIKDSSHPEKFSANWLMPVGERVLDLYGALPQIVTGYGGTVTNDIGLTLAPTQNMTYAGMVAGAGLVLDAASAGVTQTIAGVNSYVGATHVKRGVLAVNPMAAFPELDSDIVAYWPCDTMVSERYVMDLSGNGNTLVTDGARDVIMDQSNSIADSSLFLPRTVLDERSYMYCNAGDGLLNGFDAEKDNSFTVACWLRVDEVRYREGPFSFGKSIGVRFGGTDSSGNTVTTENKIYYGDSGYMKQSPSAGAGWLGKSRWVHFALMYDSGKAAAGEVCYTLFTNGVVASSTAEKNSGLLHPSGAFYLGRGAYSAAQTLKGAYDDVVILKGSTEEDVKRLYGWRRGEHETSGATGVLPEDSDVTVDAGATLFLTNAVEKVHSLSGAGTVFVSRGSTFEVMKANGFTGTVTGGGRFLKPALVISIR